MTTCIGNARNTLNPRSFSSCAQTLLTHKKQRSYAITKYAPQHMGKLAVGASSELMEMIGQLQASSNLLPGEESPVPCAH